jgi:peptide/nickel transport system permease protein
VPLKFALRRLIAVIPTFLLVSVLIFVLVRLLPGDPAQLMLGEAANPESIAALNRKLGLDQPLPVQYYKWFSNALRLDLGRSNTGTTVNELIQQKLPITFQLTLIAVTISVLLAFVAGTISALQPNGFWDKFITVVSISGVCLPTFFTGILLIYAFSIELRWFPSSGYVSFVDNPAQNLRLMVLPAITLGFYSSAVLTRFLRTSMLEVFNQDFIRTGRSKGVPRVRLVFRHVLRNAIIPVVTVLGLQIGLLLGGAIITEQVFSIPGLGNLLVYAVLNRDLATIQGIALVTAVSVFFINFLVDIAYASIDPRIRF